MSNRQYEDFVPGDRVKYHEVARLDAPFWKAFVVLSNLSDAHGIPAKHMK